MNILAIDTTTKTASVSVKYNENTFMDKITNEITHSEKLLPLIDKVLTSSNLSINDISTLACVNGPGSFTGIRIGIATIKALAQAKQLNIFSINSLELIAYTTFSNKNLTDNYHIISLVSTNNDRVFYCVYKLKKVNKKISIEALTKIQNDYIEDATEKLQTFINENNIKSDVYVAGNCINQFENILSKLNYHKYNFYPDTNDCIQALYGLLNVSSYMFTPYDLKPTYARLSQAERISNEKN